MKFLCPSCKAKYQIADEKVIGRSVKMKCRQCGHLIEIQESVVGASTGSSLPPVVTPSQVGALLGGPSERPEPPAKSPPGEGQIPLKAAPKREPLGRPAINKPGGEHSAVRVPAHKPLSPAATRPVAKPLGVAPPAAAPPRKKPDQPTPAAKPFAAPTVTRPVPKPTATPAPEAVAPSAINDAPAERQQPSTSPSIRASATSPSVAPRKSGEALAEAFSSAVGAQSDAASEQYLGDEWYVGINDSPVGPIPLSELRARASQGQVTIDSLVWRDGFEDWKPLRSFPELLAVVEEAISSIQANRAPLIAPDFRSAAGSVIAEPAAAAAPGASITSAAVVSKPSPGAEFVPVASPQLSAEEIAAATGRSVHRGAKGAWVAVAGALALGLAMGFVFFKQAPAAPEIKYVEVQRSAAPAPATAAPAASEVTEDVPVVASADQIKGVARKAAPSDKPAGDGANAAQGGGLKGLSGLRALGPQSGPSESGANPGASGGQALDSATLQKNVSRYTPSVRRSCWQPALDSRAADAPTSARVSVKIDIAPSGNVSGVSSSGDPRGYRGLASCIESRVRNWTFPPSSGATTVNVPFVFAAQ